MQESEYAIEDLIEALTSADAYPRSTKEVQVLQTHISVLFFAGDRVYKLKKPVRTDFLDYTDVEQRKRYCEEEVRLNRRLSPSMYLGVLPITQDEDGVLRIDGRGTVVDWVVEMVRLPANRMLDALLEQDAIGEADIEEIARVLARFHERARTGPGVNRFALALEVVEQVDENIRQLIRALRRHPGVMSRAALRFLRAAARCFPLEHRELLERRVALWKIREGHGDLHAGNICLWDGDVFIYDCVEFDRRLRSGDVASDLAFLAMDLDHRGYPNVSEHLVQTYAEFASDADLERLVPYYKAHRALVRAKVELLVAEDDSLADEARDAAVEEALRYGQLAVGYVLPVSFVVVCGASAADRSRVSDYLAERLRANRIHGGDDEGDEPADDVERWLARSLDGLRSGSSVVMDTDAGLLPPRGMLAAAARRLGIRCCVLVLEEPGGRHGDHPAEMGVAAPLDGEPARDPFGSQVLRRPASESASTHCHEVLERLMALADHEGERAPAAPAAPEGDAWTYEREALPEERPSP